MTYWLGKTGKGCTRVYRARRAGADATMTFLSPTRHLPWNRLAAGSCTPEFKKRRGGVARYYRSDLGQKCCRSPPRSPATRSALCCSSINGRATPAYLDAGLRAARFLTRIAWDARLGTFPFELNGACADRASRISSIVGSSCAGCCTLGASPKIPNSGMRLLRADERCWPIFPRRVGCIRFFCCRRSARWSWEPRWSASPGCYQLKSAMAWQELFEVTGESAFQRGYESALQAALENDPEFLPGDADSAARHGPASRLLLFPGGPAAGAGSA